MVYKRPVIIGGHARSGTTLLRNIISSHPDIEGLRRDQPWWRYFYGASRYRGLGNDPSALRLLLDDIFDSPTLHNLRISIDRSKVEAELALLKSVTFGDVFRIILEQNARNHNKPRWVFKTPGSEKYADAIFAAYPDALMVQIIRDPRDVLASLQASAQWGRSAVPHMINWTRSVYYARRNLAAYPDSYYVVQYEQLVQNLDETLNPLFSFLELDYSPEYLDADLFKQTSSFTDVSSYGISRSSVGRHVSDLSETDIAICNILGRRSMLRYGYALNTVKIPASVYIRAIRRIAVQWPTEQLRRAKRSIEIKVGWLDPAGTWLTTARRRYLSSDG